MIAITTGSKGSIVIKNGEIISSPAVKITPVDTNGAGDMYAGSFMHAYLQGSDLSTCAEFSNFASSKIVETFGPRLTTEGYIPFACVLEDLLYLLLLQMVRWSLTGCPLQGETTNLQTRESL